jgi:hypothetical protein
LQAIREKKLFTLSVDNGWLFSTVLAVQGLVERVEVQGFLQLPTIPPTGHIVSNLLLGIPCIFFRKHIKPPSPEVKLYTVKFNHPVTRGNLSFHSAMVGQYGFRSKLLIELRDGIKFLLCKASGFLHTIPRFG